VSGRVPEVNVTFSEQWWHARGGFDFSAEQWQDPILRTERDMAMRRWLYEQFGDVGLGEPDPGPKPTIEAYGHRFVPALFGCEIRYARNQAPCEVPLHLSLEEMAHLRAPDLETSPVIRKARRDGETLRARYGTCDGAIMWGGPLNAGLSVVGQELLSALALAPGAARHVLFTIAELLLRLHDEVCAAISPELYDPAERKLALGNCPVIMVSPETYRHQVLPADRWLRAHSTTFGMHHCAVITKYLPAYQELAPLNWVQPGWGSDLAAVRRTFPEATLSLLMECSAVRDMSYDDIDETVVSMLRHARPMDRTQDIFIADVSDDISDEKIRRLRTCHVRLKEKLLASA